MGVALFCILHLLQFHPEMNLKQSLLIRYRDGDRGPKRCSATSWQDIFRLTFPAVADGRRKPMWRTTGMHNTQWPPARRRRVQGRRRRRRQPLCSDGTLIHAHVESISESIGTRLTESWISERGRRRRRRRLLQSGRDWFASPVAAGSQAGR